MGKQHEKEMKDNEEIRILEEILKWQRLQGLEILKSKLEDKELFPYPESIQVYYHSNGENSIRGIVKLTGVSRSKVSLLWKKWLKAGIAEEAEEHKGRCKKSFDLMDFGIYLPSKTKKGKID